MGQVGVNRHGENFLGGAGHGTHVTNENERTTTATGLKYPQVSQSFYNAAHEVMSQRATGEEAVKKLESRLKQIRRKHW